MTREELADRSGVPKRALERLERGESANPGCFTVFAVASALALSLNELAEAATTTPTGLVSAGYEGRTIDGFVEALSGQGVAVVADVRLTPLSRKPGFSKTRLAAALGEAGIRYRHLKALGNPKGNRPPFWEGRPEEGRAEFRRLLEGQEPAVQLSSLFDLAQQERVAVLCFEHDEERCHRKVILDMARARGELSVLGLS